MLCTTAVFAGGARNERYGTAQLIFISKSTRSSVGLTASSKYEAQNTK